MIILSIVIGLIISGPSIIFKYHPEYRGISMMHTDTEDFYLSRINAAYDGCIMTCNPFNIPESSNFPFFDPSISTTILAIPGIITGIPTEQIKIIYEFILPIILSLLIYTLIFRISKTRQISTIGTLLIMLGSNIININDLIYIPNIISTLTLSSVEYLDFLPYARIVNPTFSSIFFFIYLHVLLSTSKNTNKKNLILLGALYGISFYIYFYTYLFVTSIMIVCIISFLYRKQYATCFHLSLSFISGIIIGSPIIYMIRGMTLHPLLKNMLDYGITHTHIPQISLYGVCLAITFISIIIIKIKRKGYLSGDDAYIIILVASSFLVLNQHIFSGTIIQYFHFNNYYVTPIFIISICYIIKDTVQTRKIGILLLIPVIVITIINGVLIQNQVYKRYIPRSILNQKDKQALDFINKNIPRHKVIIAPSIENLIPIYTHVYQLWTVNSKYHYLHSKKRELLGENVLLDHELFKKALTEYDVEFLILTKKELLNLDQNIKKYLKEIMYVDDYLYIYKVGI